VSPQRPRWEAQRAAEIATRRAVLARDAGLRRVSLVTRWMVAGAVGLSGALALLAANAFHGHTIQSAPSSSTTNEPSGQTTPATTTPATTAPATTTPSSGGLQPPSQAPAPAPAPAPVVVSGGS
jgi:hypothetical protein